MIDENDCSEDYPIGGMIEPFDIWQEKELLNNIEDLMEQEDEERLEEDEDEEQQIINGEIYE